MDFTSLYSTRIQSSFDDDQAEILKTFSENYTTKAGSKVTLTNYYRGLPIIYPATILGVEHGNLDLEVRPQQAVAMASDHYTLLRSPLFSHPIVAHVQYVNIKKHVALLTKLSFVEVLAEKRAAVRLNLDPMLQTKIKFDGQEIDGHLVDISVQGVAISVDTFVPMESGVDMEIEFMLPDPVSMKEAFVAVPAVLVDVVGDAAPYRYKFRISPEKHQEQLISRYSFQRQVEIIRGLKDLVD